MGSRGVYECLENLLVVYVLLEQKIIGPIVGYFGPKLFLRRWLCRPFGPWAATTVPCTWLVIQYTWMIFITTLFGNVHHRCSSLVCHGSRCEKSVMKRVISASVASFVKYAQQWVPARSIFLTRRKQLLRSIVQSKSSGIAHRYIDFSSRKCSMRATS